VREAAQMQTRGMCRRAWLIACVLVGCAGARTTLPRPAALFVEARDHAQLHCLDWGGAKQPLLLLAGLGDTAYIYSELAPRLTDRFHVFALTRRGYGESDVTRDGYGISDRVADLRDVLDKLHIDRVVLVGHSAAGDELTAFALQYPQRVKALVYLDAAYDRADPDAPAPHMDAWKTFASHFYGMTEDESYRSLAQRRKALANLFRANFDVTWSAALERNLVEVSAVNVDGSVSGRTPAFVSAALAAGAKTTTLHVADVGVPALLIFARGSLADSVLTDDVRQAIRQDERDYAAYFNRYIARIRSANPALKIITLDSARHYFYLASPDQTATWIRDFG
jgi:pimeloyl-ACP methyl ester carboxylesterase